MEDSILLSTAYLPPIEYFAFLDKAKEAYTEREENYVKQSYRNRCSIIASGGIQFLIVPVYLGSFHKTPIKEIRIDYSKRWQQVHLGSLTVAYRSSPFFIYYFGTIEKIILANHAYLLDLNMALTMALMEMLRIDTTISFTSSYRPEGTVKNDFRYLISPKKVSYYESKEYIQVFSDRRAFVPGLSIIDLIFNTGPDAGTYL